MSDKNFKYIVRVANTDLKGEKPLLLGLQRIKGIGFIMANAILSKTGLSKTQRVGNMNDEDVATLDKAVRSINDLNLPSWLLNRRKDMETGEDKHIISNDLVFTIDNDKKHLQKIRSYRGFRHAWGLPSRGQRTQSNCRPNKGKAVVGKKKSTIRK